MPCIPPKYPSNFLFDVPNRKIGAEGKRNEKSQIYQKFIRCAVVFPFQSRAPDDLKDHQMTPNGKPSPKLKIPCANNTCARVEQHGPALQGERSALRAVAQCAGDPHHRHCKQLEIERFWAAFLFLLSSLYFGVFWEDIDDCIRRRHLTGEIQMCINVACCADVAVTQPLLNLLQAHAIGIEQTGAAMAQVVETDTLHLVC